MTQPQTNWIDISVPLQTGMVHWPGDPEPSFQRIADIDQGSDANVTLCRHTAHTGTHMDAPCHFIPNGAGIETFPLHLGIGPVRIINLPATPIVSKNDLHNKGIQKGERIILKTSNSDARWHNLDFKPNFVAINASGAQFLVDAGVSLIGVDYLSVGAYEGDGVLTHRILLGAGVWIVEGLQLGGLEEGVYDMISACRYRLPGPTALPPAYCSGNNIARTKVDGCVSTGPRRLSKILDSAHNTMKPSSE